jgi:xylan 1,4-beta-xylosidase
MRGTWVGLMFLCAMQAVAQAPAASAGSGDPVSIRVDLQKSVGAYKPIYSWFGYDEANYTCRSIFGRIIC